MLNVGVIGIGNCGNQVAKLAMNELKCDVLAINSSKNDLSTLGEGVPVLCLGDERGAGKNRTEAKLFLKKSIMDMIQKEEFKNFMSVKDVIFIVSSTGGGTGSGMAPVLSSIIRKSFRDEEGKEKTVILIGVLPKLSEAYSTQVNTLEYMEELHSSIENPTYMMYDNERLSKEPTHVMMQRINQSIIDDIHVLQGYYNFSTPFSSIDEKDMKMIIQTTGRIFIASLTGLKEKDVDEKSIEDLLVEKIKRNTHAEIDRNKVVNRTGIITNLSENLNNQFDTHLQTVQEFVGSPIEEFEHVVVNSERAAENNVFFIMSGLTSMNDRIEKIKERIEEIQELQKTQAEENALDGVDISELNQKREYRESASSDEKVNLEGIFADFNV